MATIKHIASKNSNYGDAEMYLTFEHDEYRCKPIRDDHGNLVPRQDYRIETLLCGDDDFAIACMKANLSFGKNLMRGDIKTHHYIISFDPRDAKEHQLDVDRAQSLGVAFCKEHFPGHQALVCTHPDGHHHSGNIHVHIVINSLRIEAVPFMPYMDRPCDTKAGMKHRCTASAMRYLRAEVMEMCHREGLYQIDLLNGSKNRITEQEYHAQQHGQRQLDEENAPYLAIGIEPPQTKFETDKERLRQMLREVLDEATSLPDYFSRLSQYGITAKESRGRLSYLTPYRTKPITSRKLGDDYSLDAVTVRCQENAERQSFINSISFVPATPVFHEQSVWQKAGYDSPEALDNAIRNAQEQYDISAKELDSIDRQLNEKKELLRHVIAYREGHALREERDKRFFNFSRKKFESQHEEAFARFYAAEAYFHRRGMKKVPTVKRTNEEIEALIETKNQRYNTHQENKSNLYKLTDLRDRIAREEKMVAHADKAPSRQRSKNEFSR